ncbi:MAG: phosphoribosyl-AMP cyclohydrolase [Desulfobacca sp.]|uniref:phosphoribosyl-AMP cyclohydrolase n=1 Tax=Desulfobacca sp. TaxID=2067990 RepID=UPI00404B9651
MELNFSKLNGLVPAIIQDEASGEILMLGFMNQEAWDKTQSSGRVHFYSRGRQKLWCKGETSGHVQLVKEIYVDCDDDAVLVKVKQVGGAACHTGYRSCFYRQVKDGRPQVVGVKVFDPKEVYGSE